MANRYWVGGTATWDTTAGSKWSTTSGGAGGAAVPTAADDVFINAASGAVTITCGGTDVFARSLDCNGFTGTLDQVSALINLGDATAGAGNVALRFSVAMTLTNRAIGFNMISTSATVQTIETNNKITGNFIINGTGSSYQLASSFTVNTARTLTLSRGTFDTNNFAVACGNFSFTNTTVRTLILGTSTITVSGQFWGANGKTTVTNLTFSGASSTIVFSANGNFGGGGLTYGTVNLVASQSNIWDSNTFATLTKTNAAVKTAYMQIEGGTTQTVTGTFTVNANSVVNRIQIYSVSSTSSQDYGTNPAIINAAVGSLSNVDFAGVTAAGAASPFTGTSFGDGQGNTNITFDSPLTLYRVGAGGNWSASNWSLSSGGATGQRVPLPQDNVMVDAGASGTITMDMLRVGMDIDFTGFAGTAAFSSVGNRIYGSLTLGSGMAVSGTNTTTVAGRGSHTINPNGITLTQALVIHSAGGSYTLQGDITVSVAANNVITCSSGTFDANGYNLTAGRFSAVSVVARTINMGSGTWTLGGTGTIWNTTGANLAMNPGSSTIVVSDTSASSKTFSSSGFTFPLNNLSITSGGTGPVVFNISTSFLGTFTIGAPKTVTFASNGTFSFGDFIAVGTAGNIITLQASTPGTRHILTKASGTISSDYLSLQDSTATGGATWFAGANSAVVSNVSGWNLRAASPQEGNFFHVM